MLNYLGQSATFHRGEEVFYVKDLGDKYSDMFSGRIIEVMEEDLLVLFRAGNDSWEQWVSVENCF